MPASTPSTTASPIPAPTPTAESGPTALPARRRQAPPEPVDVCFHLHPSGTKTQSARHPARRGGGPVARWPGASRFVPLREPKRDAPALKMLDFFVFPLLLSFPSFLYRLRLCFAALKARLKCSGVRGSMRETGALGGAACSPTVAYRPAATAPLARGKKQPFLVSTALP